MSEIKYIGNKETKTINSREVANMVGMMHKHLIKKIEAHLESFNQRDDISFGCYFLISSYLDGNNQSRKCYEVTVPGLKLLIDSLRKTPKLEPIIELYSELSPSTHKTVLIDRKETEFVDMLESVLAPLGLTVERQKQVLKYRLDVYIPEINVAIEYDEVAHANYSYDEEEGRQRDIERKLGCKFIRLDERVSHSRNVGIVISRIVGRLK